MRIRLMRPADIPIVAGIERISNSQPWTQDDFEESLAREDGTTLLLVAEDEADGGVTGYIVLYIASGEGEIVTIAVDPCYRRRGIASGLIEDLPGFAAKMGALLTELNLEVRKSNLAAIHLYEACDFSKVGVRPGFYASPREDAILMKRILNA